MLNLSIARDDVQTPELLDGVELTILRWPDRIDVQYLEFGPDFDDRDYQTTECPPCNLAAAVAAAVARVAAFAAGGKGGAA